ncbi:hypothetical protein Pmani_022051 [Petrolisthes manimaculis]|uniref:Uncharacterized protein n=1 Tax=Petrolisthes manimaculis TaxID=1843537 RepID=A0AAE1PEL0_9EUCA|nr:hypothetical protein Pmani_022051 [Petrolisthes manimaculis]
MILFKKFLLMNFSAPCRQSGLYAFLAAMGTPEEEERPVKLTRFKKMSSTPELDKEDDGEECEVDSYVSDSDEEMKCGEQGREDDEVNSDCPENEMVPKDNTSETTPVTDDGGSGGDDVQEDKDVKLILATSSHAEETNVGLCDDEVDGGHLQQTYKLLSEMMETSLLLQDTSSECSKVNMSGDGDIDGVCSESGSGDGAKIVTDSECPADTEAGQRITTCHTIEEGAAEGLKEEELEGKQVNSTVCVREEKSSREEQPESGARKELRPEGAGRELRDIREEPTAECLSSDDQDSLHLSDVEDTHSSFNSSTSTTSSSPTTTSTSTQATSSSTTTSPLDLSDLLRISEDVLAQSPGKTLDILQVNMSLVLY